MTKITLTVANPKDPKRQIRDEFLVDSGAAFTVLPADLVAKLKLLPIYEKKFSLADGRTVTRKIGSALIKLSGREIPSPVVLGKKNDNKLLGALTLESFGLVLDPFERKICEAKLML